MYSKAQKAQECAARCRKRSVGAESTARCSKHRNVQNVQQGAEGTGMGDFGQLPTASRRWVSACDNRKEYSYENES